MTEDFRLDTNSRNSPRRPVLCTAGLILLIASGAASAAPEDNSVRGVSSIAQASASIIDPVSLRAVDLQDVEMEFGRASGLSIAPAAIFHRDCADDQIEQRCNLIILDLP